VGEATVGRVAVGGVLTGSRGILGVGGMPNLEGLAGGECRGG